MDIETIQDNQFSHHGSKRPQQRGVKMNCAKMLISFADREVPVRKGCVSLSVSKSKLERLVFEGRLDAQTAEKMKNLVVVAANDNEELHVVTVLHAKNDMRGRHYRKNIKMRRNHSKKEFLGIW